CDVLIVGGGLAGASLAVALRGSHHRVALVEARPPVRPQGWDQRVYAVSPASQAFLERIGVWNHLDLSRVHAVDGMAIRGDAGGALDFSAYDAGLPELAWIVESSLMHLELWESLRRQHNVELLCPAVPASLEMEADAAVLRLADGHRLRARLVIAADGANSWVREQVGVSAALSPYGELGVVANLRCERPHRGIARQWFRDDGVLAWLPLPGNRVSIVWSTPETHAQALLELDPAAFARRVSEAGAAELGQMQAEGAAAAFPLRLLRVRETVRARVALIGDAAHAIHPLSGHGINLGFSDAAELAERLNSLPAWRDPGELSVLRGYARARAEEPALMQAVTHALNRLFNADHPLVRSVRNHGMNLTARLPVLNNALVRYATSGKF
ncbi:MAG: UbiH/UbiF family hydroxylase, partial [Pseudazoarcus pumilus]|nr:UbiH/UbiF family hydroxylase [Pseudazoarcus pumilus]